MYGLFELDRVCNLDVVSLNDRLTVAPWEVMFVTRIAGALPSIKAGVLNGGRRSFNVCSIAKPSASKSASPNVRPSRSMPTGRPSSLNPPAIRAPANRSGN